MKSQPPLTKWGIVVVLGVLLINALFTQRFLTPTFEVILLLAGLLFLLWELGSKKT